MVHGRTRLKVRFDVDAVVLEDYPFLARNRNRRIPAAEITEIVVGWIPPSIRTSDGEFIFIPATMVERRRSGGPGHSDDPRRALRHRPGKPSRRRGSGGSRDAHW